MPRGFFEDFDLDDATMDKLKEKGEEVKEAKKIEVPQRKLINPVETERAHYEFVLGHHNLPNPEDIDGIHALVIESGAVPKDDDLAPFVAKHVQFRTMVEAAHERGIPVFFPDINPPFMVQWQQEYPMTPELQAHAKSLDPLWAEIDRLTNQMGKMKDVRSEEYSGLKSKLKDLKKEYSAQGEGLNTIYGPGTLDEQLMIVWGQTDLKRGKVLKYDPETDQSYRERNIPLISWRDAITSEKLVEIIAPTVATEIDRRPNIMIVYGQGHMGMYQCVQDEERRADHLEEMYASDLLPDDLYDLHRIMRSDPVEGKSPTETDGWVNSDADPMDPTKYQK